MIAYLNGTITSLTPTLMLIETGGVGYEVHISLQTYSMLNGQKHTKIITHHHVREDAQILFGFATEKEKQLFLMLISVNGIGPNTARTILSYASVDELLHSIANAQLAMIQKIKGIGVKTAQRIVVELREKAVQILGTETQYFLEGNHTNLKEEALLALVALGFPKPQMDKILTSILRDSNPAPSVEALIKQALKLV